MIDEIFDRQYQAGRAELNSGIDRLLARVRGAIVPAFAAIYHFQWDAPWQSTPGSGKART